MGIAAAFKEVYRVLRDKGEGDHKFSLEAEHGTWECWVSDEHLHLGDGESPEEAITKMAKNYWQHHKTLDKQA